MMETTGKIRQIELQKTDFLIVLESLNVPPEHTHLHSASCLDTSEKFAWI